MYCSNTYRLTLLFLHILLSVKTETGADVDDGQVFLKWNNGGGHFHKSACIDPTVVIEIGAIVHPKSMLGANVHVGSGTAIGPCVKIGQFTKIG